MDRATGSASDLGRIGRALDSTPSAEQARPLIEELALLARHDRLALERLLAEIAARDLVGASLRAVFFDDALVDDALQETLMSVLGGLATFRGESTFRTWLDRVARNAAHQVRRREVGRAPNAGASSSAGAYRSVPEGSHRISSMVADRQLIDAILEALGDEHREVMVLREVEGFSYEEIADRLGVPVGTVRSRLSRARQEFVAHLVQAGAGS